jgi:hypothetical protein
VLACSLEGSAGITEGGYLQGAQLVKVLLERQLELSLAGSTVQFGGGEDSGGCVHHSG